MITISEALTRPGETISCIQGKITTCYKHEGKQGQYGPYTLQGLTINDGTGSIKVSLFDQRDMKAFTGKNIVLNSGKDKNGNLSGVKAQERDIKGKKIVELKVSGLAHIDAGVEASGSTESPQADMPADATDEEKTILETLAKVREAKARKLQEEAAARARTASESSTDGRDVQIGNLYVKALKMALWACNGQGVPFFSEAVATVFIAMRDDGLTDKMPKTFASSTRLTEEPDIKALADPAVQPDPVEDVDQEPVSSWKEVVFNGVKLGVMEPEMLEVIFNSFRPKPDPKTGKVKIEDEYVVNAVKQWKKEQL